jgi:hypothetical protein
MRGAIPPLFQYVFIGWCLVKHRDNFTLTFYKNFIHVESIGFNMPTEWKTTESELQNTPQQETTIWTPSQKQLDDVKVETQ